MTSRIQKTWGLVAIGFGALTLLSGGTVMFGGEEAAARAGNVVGAVLWFNTLSGVVYIIAGLCMFQGARHARTLATLLALAIGVAFAAFGLHVMGGGAFEHRTVGAMTLRFFFWAAAALYLYRTATPRTGAFS